MVISDKTTEKTDDKTELETMLSDAKGSMSARETKEPAQYDTLKSQADTLKSQADTLKSQGDTLKSEVATTGTEEDFAKQGIKKGSVTTSPKYGTWDGAFVNVFVSILGVIMFLRLAFVVGETGLPYFIVILGLSTLVTVLTSLSLSAICSNGIPKGGGAYYMISRTIGPHIGTAIGLLLSIGMSVAISSYIIGFAETMQSNIGLVTDSPRNGLFLCVWFIFVL
ncbi:hypothetical protein RFI_03084, partial [Reticulomyxa filosa]